MLIAGLILLTSTAAGSALAQSSDGCPDGPNCIDASGFNADLDGWSARNVRAEWYEWVDILLTRGFGLAKISDAQYGDPGMVKSFFLQPGQYQLRTRAVGDLVIINNFDVFVDAADIDLVFSGVLSAWYWQNYTFGTFTVTRPELVTVAIKPEVDAPYVFLDYVYLEKMPDNYPTATPGRPTKTVTPGGPTATITPTPIPAGNQATPIPPGTAVCQPVVAGLPTYAITATDAITGFSILESFSQDPNTIQVLPWSKNGEVEITAGNDHTGNGSGAAFIKYDPHWGETTAADFTHALILKNNFSGSFYINAWAQADVVPSAQTAKLEIWQLVGGVWEIASAEPVSAAYWYPVHAQISASATRVAFVAARSDIPTSGYIVLDDVVVYAPLSAAPYCDGTYRDGTVGDFNRTSDSAFTMQYPSDKPCPGAIMQPNNFWGMILAQLTIFLDGQMAMAPAHILGTTRDLAQQYMLGPVGGLIVLATIVLDWNVPIIMLEVYLAFQAGLAVVGVWKLIRRAFIV
jgi:hypothetical protein